MNLGDIFNLLLLQPTINLIAVILRALEALQIPGALGLSIMLLTVIVKLITWPLTSQQIKASKKMAELKPHLDKLKEKHKGDQQAMAKAQMELYKEHGINPAGGCLPAIIQILLIYPLYQVIQAFFDPTLGLEKINYFLYSQSWRFTSLPDPHFLGLSLADKPSDFARAGAVVLVVPLLTAVLQLVLSKMMSPTPVKPYPTDTPSEVKEKIKEEDMATAMQSQMLVMMPIMIGFFAYQFPIGLSLYWNVLTIMGIYQQYRISGWGGLANWLNKLTSLSNA